MSTDWHKLPFIPVRYFDSLVALTTPGQQDRAALLDRAGLSVQRLAAPDRLLRLPEVERLVATCLQASGDPALALRLGSELNLSAHGTLGFAGLSSPTLEAAIQVAEEFFPLVTPLLGIRYRRRGDSSRLTVFPACPLSPGLHRFLVETLLASLHAQGRFLLEGRIPEVRIRVPFAERLPLYRRHFPELRLTGVGGREAQVLFPAAVMDTPLPLANAGARDQARRQCHKLMRRLPHPEDLSRTVTGLLHESEAHWNAAAVARRLGLSERQLRRQLASRGTGFRDLLNGVRMERARTLLREQGLSVTETAWRSGYTEVANFSRAWRRHFGYPPREA